MSQDSYFCKVRFFIVNYSIGNTISQSGGVHNLNNNGSNNGGVLFNVTINDQYGSTYKDMTAHELGHWLGFYHPFKEPNNPTLLHRIIGTQNNLGQTQNNFMDYNIKRKSWFKYQLKMTTKLREPKKTNK